MNVVSIRPSLGQRLRAGWRGALRLPQVLWHVGRGWWRVRSGFVVLPPAQQQTEVRQWAEQMLAIMGIRLQVLGTPPAGGPLLLVANHISWLDILVMHAARPCGFVSKAVVGRWPVIGGMATAAGTLYIERSSRRDAMRVVHSMANALKGGAVLAVFPEGTTGDGRTLLPFHANLLQAAISAEAPVMPVALDFIDSHTGRRSAGPSYVGDETLIGSLWRTLCSHSITAVVHYGAAQPSAGRERREWAQALQLLIAEMQVKLPD